MIIKNIFSEPFNFKLKENFKTSTNTIKSRRGIYVSVEDELGNISTGEVAPLVGFSAETLNEAYYNIKLASELLLNKNIIEFKLPANKKLLPSVSFGLEQAILGLTIKREKEFLKNKFKLIPQKNVLQSAVIGIESKNEILKRVTEYFNNGVKTIKLKIGQKHFSEDLKTIDLIQNKFGDKLKIRLDANGAWEKSDLENNLKELENYKIEFIEDPSLDLKTLIYISRKSKTPIAPDFSIKNIGTLKTLIDKKTFKFLIVKPTILGFPVEIIKLIKKANNSNINLIISSSFETKTGSSFLNFLASLVRHKYAHGLGVSKYFE